MKLFQSSLKKYVTEKIIKIDKESLAKIVEEDESSYQFSFNFSLSLKDTRLSINDIDRIEVTFWDANHQFVSESKPKIIVDKSITSLINKVPTTVLKSVSIKNQVAKTSIKQSGSKIPILSTVAKGVYQQKQLSFPVAVTDKLRSGVKMIEKLNEENFPIARVSLPIVSYTDSLDTLYSYTGIVSDDTDHTSKVLNNINFDPSDIISRINRELIEPTEVVTLPALSSVTSVTDINSVKKEYFFRGVKNLHIDTVEFLLNKVSSHPRESEFSVYSLKNFFGKLETIPVKFSAKIGKEWCKTNISVRFELIKKDTTIIETEIITLGLPQYVEAFNSMFNPPFLSVEYHSKTKQLYTVTINDKEKNGKIAGWNIYEKIIHSDKSAKKYKKIGYVKNTSPNTFEGNISEKLSILRVVPVDNENKETHNFTNIVLGQGYSNFGKLTLVARNVAEGTYIEIYNIPEKSRNIVLFSRDCSSNQEEKFEALQSSHLSGVENYVSFFVNLQADRIYEFYATCQFLEHTTGNFETILSNFVMYNNRKITPNSSISVKISNVIKRNTDVEFELKTYVTESENEKITTILKQQIPELYEQYLSPSNNTESPVGGEVKGVPKYSDLFFHEVIRTNLSTSEREVFNLVSDGVFYDDQMTRTISHVKEIDPEMDYIYQVYTFRKNPIELFKKFVAHGKYQKTGKDWFYLPYKWRNKKSLKGELYADDSEGVPIIEAYENFTSEPYGETCTYKLKGLSEYVSVKGVSTKRIDSSTVKISWETETDMLDFYESFIVMKVVNGVRSVLGRSCKDHIYHRLDESQDLGTIYYIIVPVLNEFDMGVAAYSEPILIDQTMSHKIKTGKSRAR